MDIKEEIKEESCSQDEDFFVKHLMKKDKIETVTSSSNIKLELEDSTCSQNEEQHIIKEGDIQTEIYFKEEHCLERENACISDDIRVQTHEDLYSAKPPSLYKEGVYSHTSDLFPSESSGNDISFNMIDDTSEYESDRKCHSQESVVIYISSKETSVCSKTSNDAKIVSISSPSKQSKFFQQNNKNKPNISKENRKSIMSHEYTDPYDCDVSEECLRYPSHLEKNSFTLSNKEASNCDRQDKGLNQLSSSKNYKLINDVTRTQKCNICNKAFTKLYLKRHTLTHEGLKPHKCNICNSAFTESSNLKKHTLIHEGIKPYKCNTCNKAFTNPSGLKKHELIHKGIKPHKCDLCSRAFAVLSNLKRHKLVHEGIKPHKCDVCNKAFTEPSFLKRHKLIHEGIKPHECNICSKAFTLLSNLKIHKLSHEGIKPHKCNICNKAFTVLSNLRKHKLIHGGIKPHKCNVCNKSFTELSNLKKHKLVHESIKPHHCNKAFSRTESL